MLQVGPHADSTGWREVDYGNVRFRVPADWTVHDLPASYHVVTGANGNQGGGGLADPDACGGPMFTADDPTVDLGHGTVPSCPARLTYDLEPAEGVWVREVTEAEAPTFALPNTSSASQDLLISFGDTPLQRIVPAPVFDFTIRNGTHMYSVTVGVGIDASFARSILRERARAIAPRVERTSSSCRTRGRRKIRRLSVRCRR